MYLADKNERHQNKKTAKVGMYVSGYLLSGCQQRIKSSDHFLHYFYTENVLFWTEDAAGTYELYLKHVRLWNSIYV